jgi:hypothetical protein
VDDRHLFQLELIARLRPIGRRQKLVKTSNVHPSIFSLSYD